MSEKQNNNSVFLINFNGSNYLENYALIRNVVRNGKVCRFLHYLISIIDKVKCT